MCRSELSRAHSALVAAAIRLAECMGFHRDPTTYGLSPVETHVRRLLWYQLCFLDVRTCEAYGPRLLIRGDEYDTKLPLDVDDDDLISSDDPQDQDRWTNMTFTRIRCECMVMVRTLWVDRVRLENRKASLTHVLGKIESFRKEMEERYLPRMRAVEPIQRLARCMMSLYTSRMHCMVLHRYHYSMGVNSPDKLRNLLWSSGIQSIEDAIEMETNPDLTPWVWYSGAYQQYHIALLLLLEVFAFPMMKEAERVWKGLDYVFDGDPRQSRQDKGRQLLTDLRDKFIVYRNARKMRQPLSLRKPLEHMSPAAYEESSLHYSSSRSPPEIPLKIKEQDWQPIKPSLQPPPGLSPTDSSSQSSIMGHSAGLKAGKPNWGFENSSTFFVSPTTKVQNHAAAFSSSYSSPPSLHAQMQQVQQSQPMAGSQYVLSSGLPTAVVQRPGYFDQTRGQNPNLRTPGGMAMDISPAVQVQPPPPAQVMMEDIDWVSVLFLSSLVSFETWIRSFCGCSYERVHSNNL